VPGIAARVVYPALQVQSDRAEDPASEKLFGGHWLALPLAHHTLATHGAQLAPKYPSLQIHAQLAGVVYVAYWGALVHALQTRLVMVVHAVTCVVPAGQEPTHAWQAETDICCCRLENVPYGHSVAAADPGGQYEPVGHTIGGPETDTQKEPPGQVPSVDELEGQ